MSFLCFRKNRRDGATVQTRVLALTDMVGKQLWEDVSAREELVELSEEALKAKAKGKSRRKAMNINRARL